MNDFFNNAQVWAEDSWETASSWAASTFTTQQPLETYATILAICALLALWLVLRISCRKRKIVRLFDNAAGRVQVSHTALKHLVESGAEQAGVLGKPNVRFQGKRGKLDLEVRLKVRAGEPLTEFSKNLQHKLTAILQESLGVEKVGRIDITVKGFKRAAAKPAPLTSLKDEAAAKESKDVGSTTLGV